MQNDVHTDWLVFSENVQKTPENKETPQSFDCGVGEGRWIRFSAEKPRRLRHATGVPQRAAFRIPLPKTHTRKKTSSYDDVFFLVGEGGFEPPKSLTTDLQSAPFGHSGIPPYSVRCAAGIGAGRRTRTPDLLITKIHLYVYCVHFVPVLPDTSNFSTSFRVINLCSIKAFFARWRQGWRQKTDTI